VTGDEVVRYFDAALSTDRLDVAALMRQYLNYANPPTLHIRALPADTTHTHEMWFEAQEDEFALPIWLKGEPNPILVTTVPASHFLSPNGYPSVKPDRSRGLFHVKYHLATDDPRYSR